MRHCYSTFLFSGLLTISGLVGNAIACFGSATQDEYTVDWGGSESEVIQVPTGSEVMKDEYDFLRVRSVEEIQQLSKQTLIDLPPEAYHNLPFEKFNVIDPEILLQKASALSPETFGQVLSGLDKQTIDQLNWQQISRGLNAESLNNVDMSTMQRLPLDTLLSNMRSEEVANVDITRVLDAASVNQDTLDQLPWMDISKNIPARWLNDADPQVLQRLPMDTILGQMSMEEINQLDLNKVLGAMNDYQLDGLPWDRIAGRLDANSLQMLPESFNNWETLLKHLSPSDIQHIPTSAFQKFPSGVFTEMTPEFLSSMNAGVFKQISIDKLQLINPRAFQGLSVQQASSVPAMSWGELPLSSLQHLKPNVFGSLPPVAYTSMGPQKFSAIRVESLKSIPMDVARVLPKSMYPHVSPSVYKTMVGHSVVQETVVHGFLRGLVNIPDDTFTGKR